MAVGDTFVVGDYTYTVKYESSTRDQVSVKVTDDTKSNYGALASRFVHDGKTIEVFDMSDCFRGCANLVVAPQVTIDSDMAPNMAGFFQDCASLESAALPERSGNCALMFGGCTSLATVSGKIPSGAQTYGYMFDGCASLVTAPEFSDPFYTNGGNVLSGMFKGCTSLEDASLPSRVYSSSSLSSEVNPVLTEMFRGCASLETAPALPLRTTSMASCFEDCTSLAAPPSIPSSATTMSRCFRGCTSLASPPDLSGATQLARMDYCFDGCASLETAPTIPAGVTNMRTCFQRCSSLGGAMIASNSPTEYAYVFYGTTESIYVILTGAADAHAWRAIAQQYDNVYLFSDNSAPTVELSVYRCDSAGNAAEEGTYAHVTAVVTVYEDAVPSGTNSVASKTFKIDGAASTQSWAESVASLTYTYTAIVQLGDTGKHVFALKAVDAFAAESIEVSVILVSAAPAIDFHHGLTDNGAAFGKIATREGIVDSTWDWWEHGERMYPTFTRSSWSTSSDESTLPVTPCFVLDTTTGGLYWCDGQ